MDGCLVIIVCIGDIVEGNVWKINKILINLLIRKLRIMKLSAINLWISFYLLFYSMINPKIHIFKNYYNMRLRMFYPFFFGKVILIFRIFIIYKFLSNARTNSSNFPIFLRLIFQVKFNLKRLLIFSLFSNVKKSCLLVTTDLWHERGNTWKKHHQHYFINTPLDKPSCNAGKMSE